MVDFRYHVVSLIAVFLALAVGIVLGTAALNGPIQDNLNANISRLTEDKRVLQQDVERLRAQVGAGDQFAAAVGPGVVDDALADRRVLLVTTASTPPSLAEQMTPLLIEAGAEVTGTLRLQPALSDPGQAALVQDLVAEVVPAGVELPAGPPVVQATAQLAAVLVRAADTDAVPADQAQAVVSAYVEADLVEYRSEQETLRPATLALVLTGTPPETRDEQLEREQSALLVLVSALDSRSDGAVLAGPTGSGGGRGAVAALRGQPDLVQQVSTVDNADRGTGRVATVLALAQQAAGRAGQYGAGGGAAGAVPPPP